MGVVLAERGVRTEPPSAPPVRSAWRSHWPLTLLFLGLPLWWALGFMTVLPLAVSLVMVRDLRRRRVVLPPGFALWALFLVWVLLGVFVLWADAPEAVPGGGPSRLLVFLSRAAWYFASTVVMLWVANRRESELSTRWVFQLLAFLFVVTTAGGVLGLLAPTFEFTSLAELLLPQGLRANALVKSMTHPVAAEIQSVLLKPGPRPQAPFAFANTWGSVIALSLPFFLVAWVKEGRRWQRVVAPVVLLTAAFPVVYSLNRGLWVCLAVGAAGLVVLELFRRRIGPLIVTLAVLGGLGVALVASPLGDVYEQRLSHQHSNERRGELLTQTVTSAAEGSPVVGFGSTRDVQGNFTSIAGGATASCSACGVPALGTQGHLWLVIFSQGFVGLALFAAFFCVFAARCWRCRSTTETVCSFVLVFFGIQLIVYDTLDLPFFVVMLTIGLAWRDQLTTGRVTSAPYTAGAGLSRLREVAPFLALCAVVGASLGGAWSLLTPVTYRATVAVLLQQVPVELETATIDTPQDERQEEATVDTEAALVVASRTLGPAARTASPAAVQDLRGRIEVTAPPETRVLRITLTEPTAARATAVARRVAGSYLTNRRADLVARRDEALTETQRQVAVLERGTSYTERDAALTSRDDADDDTSPVSLDSLQAKIAGLKLTQVEAGEILRARPAQQIRIHREVPITSGAGLGLLLASVVVAGRPGWRPGPRRLRRRDR